MNEHSAEKDAGVAMSLSKGHSAEKDASARKRCVRCGARAKFDQYAGRWVHEDPAVSLSVDHAAYVLPPDGGRS